MFWVKAFLRSLKFMVRTRRGYPLRRHPEGVKVLIVGELEVVHPATTGKLLGTVYMLDLLHRLWHPSNSASTLSCSLLGFHAKAPKGPIDMLDDDLGRLRVRSCVDSFM